jgi:hypothetical protein
MCSTFVTSDYEARPTQPFSSGRNNTTPSSSRFDEDFADTRMYPVGTHAGVIRLRVWPTTIEQIEAALDRLLVSIDDDRLPGSPVIIDAQRIRIRRAARHG